MSATQEINNLKRSFNKHLVVTLSGASINFDDEGFDTSGISGWYTVRYEGLGVDSTGMGDLVEETSSATGRYRRLKAEISAWRRNDDQKAQIGPMVDNLIFIAGELNIDFYDFADVQNPVSAGKFYIEPGVGVFAPGFGVGKKHNSGESFHYRESELVGFVLEIELTVLAK